MSKRKSRRKWERRVREDKALRLLSFKRYASALDIGRAAITGETMPFTLTTANIEAIGLKIAIDLVRCEMVRATTFNQFTLTSWPEPRPKDAPVIWGDTWDDVEAASERASA